MAELDPFAAELERRSKVGGEVRAPSSTPDPFAAELARRNASEGGATPAPGAAVPGAGPAPPQTLLGGFYGGVKRGIKEDAAMFKGAIGTGLSAVGIDAGESLLDDAISDMHRAESATPRAVPSYKDVEGVHDALMYGAETLGEQLPTIATVIAGGGLGGAAIKVGVRKAAERGLKKATQDRLEKHAFTAGAVGTATGLETGGTAAEIKESTGESNPALAIAGGVAKGALEAVTPIALAKNLGLMPSVAKGLSGTIAKALEGATVSRIAKNGLTFSWDDPFPAQIALALCSKVGAILDSSEPAPAANCGCGFNISKMRSVIPADSDLAGTVREPLASEVGASAIFIPGTLSCSGLRPCEAASSAKASGSVAARIASCAVWSGLIAISHLCKQC